MVFCTGKIFYDLNEAKEKSGADDIAIVRLEQLYPFPIKQVNEVLLKYKNAKEYCWVQEEPENMGAWAFIIRMFMKHIETQGIQLKYIGRSEGASPATGFAKSHVQQQQAIINKVFEK